MPWARVTKYPRGQEFARTPGGLREEGVGPGPHRTPPWGLGPGARHSGAQAGTGAAARPRGAWSSCRAGLQLSLASLPQSHQQRLGQGDSGPGAELRQLQSAAAEGGAGGAQRQCGGGPAGGVRVRMCGGRWAWGRTWCARARHPPGRHLSAVPCVCETRIRIGKGGLCVPGEVGGGHWARQGPALESGLNGSGSSEGVSVPMIPLGLKETKELDWSTPLRVSADL